MKNPLPISQTTTCPTCGNLVPMTRAGAPGIHYDGGKRCAEGTAWYFCTCYHSCAEDPRTACSLSGDFHVHAGEPCPVHPDAPGDH